jgi:hypothetical protein
MFPLYILLLAGALLVGLILLIVGVILLLRVKNKIAGLLVGAVGLVFTFLPLAAILYLTTKIT